MSLTPQSPLQGHVALTTASAIEATPGQSEWETRRQRRLSASITYEGVTKNGKKIECSAMQRLCSQRRPGIKVLQFVEWIEIIPIWNVPVFFLWIVNLVSRGGGFI